MDEARATAESAPGMNSLTYLWTLLVVHSLEQEGDGRIKNVLAWRLRLDIIDGLLAGKEQVTGRLERRP